MLDVADLKGVVRKLAEKFSPFADFTEALGKQFSQWTEKRMPQCEDIEGYICRGKVVEEGPRASTQKPCLTVDQQKVASSQIRRCTPFVRKAPPDCTWTGPVAYDRTLGTSIPRAEEGVEHLARLP